MLVEHQGRQCAWNRMREHGWDWRSSRHSDHTVVQPTVSTVMLTQRNKILTKNDAFTWFTIFCCY